MIETYLKQNAIGKTCEVKCFSIHNNDTFLLKGVLTAVELAGDESYITLHAGNRLSLMPTRLNNTCLLISVDILGVDDVVMPVSRKVPPTQDDAKTIVTKAHAPVAAKQEEKHEVKQEKKEEKPAVKQEEKAVEEKAKRGRKPKTETPPPPPPPPVAVEEEDDDDFDFADSDEDFDVASDFKETNEKDVSFSDVTEDAEDDDFDFSDAEEDDFDFGDDDDAADDDDFDFTE